MFARDLVYPCQCVCKCVLPMAVTSPVDIELCAVAVYQSKAWFNEGAKKPAHTLSLTHTHTCLHTCIYTHRHAHTRYQRGVSQLLVFDSYSFIFNHSSVFWVERYFMFGERQVIITN